MGASALLRRDDKVQADTESRDPAELGAAVPVAIAMMATFLAVSATDISLPWSAIVAIGHWQIIWGPAAGFASGLLISRGRAGLATFVFGLSVLVDALSMGGSGLSEVMNIQWSNVVGGFAAVWAVACGTPRLGRVNWLAFIFLAAAVSVPAVMHADLVDFGSYALVPASWASLAAGRAVGGRVASGTWPARPVGLAILGFGLVTLLCYMGAMEPSATMLPVPDGTGGTLHEG